MRALACLAAVVMAGIAWTSVAQAQDYSALIAAPDRTDADRQNDKRRDPVQLLTFAAPKTGMKVLDMGAGAGYSTELMARAVGETGKVFGQNDKVSEKFQARLQTPAMRNVVPVARAFDDPAPPEATGLDLVTFFFAYHDTTFMEVDRARMNKALFAALKSGGTLVIADHSARPRVDLLGECGGRPGTRVAANRHPRARLGDDELQHCGAAAARGGWSATACAVGAVGFRASGFSVNQKTVDCMLAREASVVARGRR